MKKLFLLLPLLLLTACSPVENSARDTSAALNAVLLTAEDENLASCQADPTQSVCTVINKGIDAENALITATEAYCGWSTTAPPDPLQKCSPVKGADAALKTAIANADQFVTEIKGVLK